jgi:hypothetical protein
MQRPFATAVLKWRMPERQLLFPTSEDGLAEAAMAYSEEINQALTDIIHCIAALGLSPVAILGSWTVLDSEMLQTFTGQAFAFTHAVFDRALHSASVKPLTLDGHPLPELIARWKEFPIAEKPVLRVALSRLNQASRRNNDVDKALDLGIALEVVLLHELQPDRGELSFRIALRGATFVGGTHVDRVANMRLLKDAYGVRSGAAHSGKVPAQTRGRPTVEVLKDVSQLCAVIARRLIERGSFPDWDVDFVLGGAG